ncbi:GDSL esterase/lipase EXL3, partial [Bienertia sinuspersici]
ELYNLGARRIGVFSTPPIGCVPSQRTVGGGILRECAENYNQACQLFNSKLSFEQSAKGCCGTGVIEVTSLLCNKLDAICPDNSKYLFWDSYHPTEKGYKTIIDLLTDKYVQSFF